ncbi:MAG TPA: response regulator transcription factor [Acidimicrobiales bacterium]|jgi:DNA-binding NarL/FixJ family response regulator|nr:response regulator transcription factor [Acidimicrobiales bacterium]
MLVDEDEIIVRGLEALVASCPHRVQVVGNAAAGEDLVRRAMDAGADVVLLDVHLRGGLSGLAAGSRLLGTGTPVRVVVFTALAEEAYLLEALRLGLAGYLLRSLSGVALAGLLERARDGEVVIDPTLATRVAIAAARHQDGTAAWPGAGLGLSHRESQVLGQLVEGLANRDIADRLGMGEETVKTHLRAIYRKLGVRDRAQAVSAALREGVYR